MSDTVRVAALLTIIAGLDSMFAGFRASCGRTGMVRHRRADREAAARGLLTGSTLLLPVVVIVVVDLVVQSQRTADYRRAGEGLLTVYLPYAVIVLLALLAYLTLGWRKRFLASALLLGPLTLARPIVAIGGAVVSGLRADDWVVWLLVAAAVVAVLAVEPAVGARWYSPSALARAAPSS